MSWLRGRWARAGVSACAWATRSERWQIRLLRKPETEEARRQSRIELKDLDDSLTDLGKIVSHKSLNEGEAGTLAAPDPKRNSQRKKKLPSASKEIDC